MIPLRVLRTSALAVLSIAVLDALFWKLEVSRIGPVLIQYTVGPKPGSQEMYVVWSLEGILVWMSLVAIWGGILAGFQGWSSRSFRLATAALLFGMQSLIILIFHPYLLLLVLGGDSDIRRFLKRWEVLAEIYDHWGLSQNFHWLVAGRLPDRRYLGRASGGLLRRGAERVGRVRISRLAG